MLNGPALPYKEEDAGSIGHRPLRKSGTLQVKRSGERRIWFSTLVASAATRLGVISRERRNHDAGTTSQCGEELRRESASPAGRSCTRITTRTVRAANGYVQSGRACRSYFRGSGLPLSTSCMACSSLVQRCYYCCA